MTIELARDRIYIRASSKYTEQLVGLLKVIACELPLTNRLVIALQYPEGNEIRAKGDEPQFRALCAIAKPWAESLAGDDYALEGRSSRRIVLRGLPD